MNHQHIVILCGGEGKRLWPLATPEHPKQFLQWTETTTLFDETVLRIQPFLDAGAQLHVVTNKKYRHFFSTYQNRVTTFFEEEAACNTAPAMLYALYGILEQDPEACVTFIPADHYVATPDLFRSAFSLFLKTIETSEKLCTMGITPTHPATEYGYIEINQGQENFKTVKRFYEKPTLDRAHLFIQNPAMLWNIGIYGGKASTFLEQYQAHAPVLIDEMNLYKKNMISYNQITHISFDYAVAEKSNKLIVLPLKSEWSDVGSLEVFLRLSPSALFYKNKEKVYFESIK
jgi:mannose-1-phosphate guanylyltransferase/mannose-6-phosphate isomerase